MAYAGDEEAAASAVNKSEGAAAAGDSGWESKQLAAAATFETDANRSLSESPPVGLNRPLSPTVILSARTSLPGAGPRPRSLVSIRHSEVEQQGPARRPWIGSRSRRPIRISHRNTFSRPLVLTPRP